MGRGVWGSPGLIPPDTPQLPYLIDGPTKLTQSIAILHYIARKHNMCEWGGVPAPGGGVPGVFGAGGLTPPHPAGGETEEEKQRVDLLENELLDMRTNFIRLCYSPDFVSTPWGFWGAGSPPDPGAVPPHGGALGHLPVRG